MTNHEKWRFFTDSFESPDLFIDWTWYLTVSAALQRRVCLFGEPNADRVTSQIYANQFVVFIGPPGVGKTQAASEAVGIFRSLVKTAMKDEKIERTELIKTGPNSITVQALYRYLSMNYTTNNLADMLPTPGPKGKSYVHASLAFFCGGELGNLIEKDSDGLVSFLTEAWEGRDFHRETKTQGVDLIKNLCVTLLGSATPAWIREVTEKRLLKQGFAARTIFLYADQKRKLTHRLVFTPQQIAARDELCKHIEKLTKIMGEVKLTPEADKFVEDWYMSGGAKPINGDKRLLDYYERKKMHLYKLAMCLHFSENLSLTLDVDTMKTALGILTSAELYMHKALSYGGENPVYSIAQEALRLLGAQESGRITFNKLLLELFDMGNSEDIQAAMQFLIDTNQVAQAQGPKGLYYVAASRD